MRFLSVLFVVITAVCVVASPCLADENDLDPIDRQSTPDAALAAYVRQEQAKLPVAGEPLLDYSSPGKFRVTYNDGQNSTVKIVPAEGLPFTQAIHVEVHQRQDPAYRVQLFTPYNQIPVKKGDVLFFSYYARTLAAQDETGQALISTLLQLKGPPWTNAFLTNTRLTRQWSVQYATAVAAQDFAPGTLGLCIHMGFYPQSFELGGIYVLNLGPNVNISKLPYTHISYTGREPDAPWRREAAARIEKYRKGDLTVQVLDASGKPVSDARVTVAMQRHAYNFGTYFDHIDFAAKPDVDTGNAARYCEFVKDNFNCVTTPIYWNWIWTQPDGLARHRLLAAWLRNNGIRTVKAHCVIWPGFRWLPPRCQELKDDPAALRELCMTHVKEALQLTRELGYQQVDVMNEPRGNRDLMNILGDEVMADWFKAARETNPDIRLYINDYSILAAGGSDITAQDAYAKIIEFLIAHNAPLDGIGMQSHFGSDLTAPPRLIAILDRFAKYGKEIASTEFDVNIEDEAAQTDYTRDFITAFFSHPATTTFIMWGFWEKTHWRPGAAMVHQDWSLKPNYAAYHDLVYKQWWTNAAGATLADGRYQARGFLGDYQITVEKEGRRAQVPTTLTHQGTTLTVTLP